MTSRQQPLSLVTCFRLLRPRELLSLLLLSLCSLTPLAVPYARLLDPKGLTYVGALGLRPVAVGGLAVLLALLALVVFEPPRSRSLGGWGRALLARARQMQSRYDADLRRRLAQEQPHDDDDSPLRS